METKIVYQAGNVTGGYAFSANKPDIILPGFAEKMAPEMQEILVFEATTARELYVASVSAKKAAGEKVNPLTIKRESMTEAKNKAIEKFGEENYNAMKKVMEDNKGGNQSVTGKKKSSKPKAEKGARPSKAPKAPVDVSDADLADLEQEFAEGPADDMDAPAEMPDPFDEEL